ncbi:hypothetical protein M8A51_24620 [Schlegelella sp. S2-27]|uniref:Uncharacterized protein n=1 Tax=Caldimonas mangrovi TaxID=2944811 RepID=A0ABT0YWK5_9BURK|nr:hypothetical protein [Caldimonas mangrovi]
MKHVLARRLTLNVLASILLASTLAGCGGGGDEDDLPSGSQAAAALDEGRQPSLSGRSR